MSSVTTTRRESALRDKVGAAEKKLAEDLGVVQPFGITELGGAKRASPSACALSWAASRRRATRLSRQLLGRDAV